MTMTISREAEGSRRRSSVSRGSGSGGGGGEGEQRRESDGGGAGLLHAFTRGGGSREASSLQQGQQPGHCVSIRVVSGLASGSTVTLVGEVASPFACF
jgi:hypothetical protein